MPTLYDAVNVDAIPADAEIVAGYVDGMYQTIAALKARFPHAVVVEITVTGRPGIRVCDCETGDLTPQQAADWARAELAAGRRPTIYCNLSTWQTVRDLLGPDADRVDWWVAHYDNDPSIPSGAAAKQYSTGNYDTSATVDEWPVTAVVVPSNGGTSTVKYGKLNAPIVAAYERPGHPNSGWLFGADGGVFNFGGAPFYGSLGDVKLAFPVVAAVAHENGYTMIGQDGGTFNFGADAPHIPSLA